MGCSTCEHVHPNIYRCGSLGLDKKRVGGIEGGR
jgi:ferredoxin